MINYHLISIYDSFNALCSLYAGGLLCARNCAQKGSVNSVCSVRDKTPHDSYWQAYRGNLTFHSPPYGGGAGGGATRFGGEATLLFLLPSLAF